MPTYEVGSGMLYMYLRGIVISNITKKLMPSTMLIILKSLIEFILYVFFKVDVQLLIFRQ